jgi:hypothetical protein
MPCCVGKRQNGGTAAREGAQKGDCFVHDDGARFKATPALLNNMLLVA